MCRRPHIAYEITIFITVAPYFPTMVSLMGCNMWMVL
jgi:hypothetical protein